MSENLLKPAWSMINQPLIVLGVGAVVGAFGTLWVSSAAMDLRITAAERRLDKTENVMQVITDRLTSLDIRMSSQLTEVTTILRRIEREDARRDLDKR